MRRPFPKAYVNCIDANLIYLSNQQMGNFSPEMKTLRILFPHCPLLFQSPVHSLFCGFKVLFTRDCINIFPPIVRTDDHEDIEVTAW